MGLFLFEASLIFISERSSKIWKAGMIVKWCNM